jgi:hypothetical protein
VVRWCGAIRAGYRLLNSHLPTGELAGAVLVAMVALGSRRNYSCVEANAFVKFEAFGKGFEVV